MNMRVWAASHSARHHGAVPWRPALLLVTRLSLVDRPARSIFYGALFLALFGGIALLTYSLLAQDWRRTLLRAPVVVVSRYRWLAVGGVMNAVARRASFLAALHRGFAARCSAARCSWNILFWLLELDDSHAVVERRDDERCDSQRPLAQPARCWTTRKPTAKTARRLTSCFRARYPVIRFAAPRRTARSR